MKEHPINNLLDISLANIGRMVDINKVIGTPLKIDENNLELVSDSLGIDYINMNKHSNIDKKLSNIKESILPII